MFILQNSLSLTTHLDHLKQPLFIAQNTVNFKNIYTVYNKITEQIQLKIQYKVAEKKIFERKNIIEVGGLNRT